MWYKSIISVLPVVDVACMSSVNRSREEHQHGNCAMNSVDGFRHETAIIRAKCHSFSQPGSTDEISHFTWQNTGIADPLLP